MTATFYLGTHMPGWLHTAGVPLFVSHRRLAKYKRLPAATERWALDSGGFTELSMYGEWRTSSEEYAEAVDRYRTEIGMLDWAAPQDWMCEPFMLAKTGKTVAEHQELTVENYIDLNELAPHLPFIPVLQGYDLGDYFRCAELYAEAGVNLSATPVVGLGSVCRRHNTAIVSQLVRELRDAGIGCHAFGLKTEGWRNCRGYLVSADSMAWSIRGRHDHIAGHPHKSEANCITYALAWRDRHIGSVWQPSLEEATA